MKITTLIENRASNTEPSLASEWGLSLHIAFNNQSILFDTGASGSFADNAKLLSVDLDSVEVLVLSHHHFDHGGGLRRFLELNSKANVYLADLPNGECYVGVLGLLNKYIGLEKEIMNEYADRFEIVSKPIEVLEDVYALPNILSNHPKPIGNKQLYLKKNDNFRPDDFTHEIVMAINDNGKLVIFAGCSHNGILNMVDTVKKEFEGIPIKAMIGGFHLLASLPFCTEDEIIIKKVKNSKPDDYCFLFSFSYRRDSRYFATLPPARTPEATQGKIPPPIVPAPTKKSPSIPTVLLPNLPEPT